ncbi:MAG: phage major capsid protein [Rhodothermaceae bacterium]|nr:phage major capsid protein [Rhodothermaceae bacterium]MBC12524.1 phage major capsid protein [Rhodothermaceae bacterium]
MRLLRAFLIAAVALFAGTASVHAEALGVDRIQPAELQVPVDHYVGFTGHTDDGSGATAQSAGLSVHLGTARLGAVLVAGVVLALVVHGDTETGVALATAGAVSTEALKAAVDESNKLVRQMLDPEKGLEAKIKALESQGEGTAELKAQVQKMATDNADAIEKINAATKAAAELQERIDAIETAAQKAGRPGAEGDLYAGVLKALEDGKIPDAVKGMGEEFRASLNGRGLSLGSFDVKAVTSLAASGGDTHVPVYEPTIIAPGQQAISLLDVLPGTRTESPIIYWVKELLGSRTDGVAIQSLDFTGTDQGTALGSSDFVFDRLSAETRTFGHTGKIAIQLLEDVSQLRGYLENQMRYMVRYDLEGQVLNGDGTGKNISGLVDQATAYDVTQDAGTTSLQKLDVLRWAINQCALTFFPATAAVAHPSDVTSIETLKDSQNRYLWAAPTMTNGGLRPWGVPVVSTTQQTIDKFLVGAMNQVEVVTRKEVEVMVATENSDDFEKLLATIRAYGRFGLKAYQPGSLIEGDFSVAITGS